MCFDHHSRPPIPPIAGGAVDSRDVTLTAVDGNRLTAFEAKGAEPSGASNVILPDVRGLHAYYVELALRFAETAQTPWQSTGSAGPPASGGARRGSSTCPTSRRRSGRKFGASPPAPLTRGRFGRMAPSLSSRSAFASVAGWPSCRRP